MKRYVAVVSYDGSGYRGWQSQSNAHAVQSEIERALSQMHAQPITIHGSGRTDAEVHALGQVFHFDSPLDIPQWKWLQAINGYLPSDIYVKSITETSPEFHARFSCTAKIYTYRFQTGAFDVHRAKYCYQLGKNVDIRAMQEAAACFIGTHDFTSFCANKQCDTPNQIRTVQSITLYQDNTEWVIVLQGDGFLRYMVRMLCACLLEVGQGRLETVQVQRWLDMKNKTCCKHNAPACGLYLKEVLYEEQLSYTHAAV